MSITGAQVPRHRDRPAERVWLFRDLPGPSILKLGWLYPRHALPTFRVQFGSPCSCFMHHVRVSPFAASSCYILLSRLDSSPTSQKPDQGLGSICVGKSRRPPPQGPLSLFSSLQHLRGSSLLSPSRPHHGRHPS